MTFNPKLVMSVHGIRTEGAWQTVLADVLGQAGIATATCNYGYFSARQLLWPPARKRKVEEFHTWYQQQVSDHKLDLDDPEQRPSIVAHSFGTYMVGLCMRKYEDVKFDKIILAGSILPRGFDWGRLFARDQLALVINECGWQDLWSGIAGTTVRGTGSSGKHGFHHTDDRFIEQIPHEEFEHSDFFYRAMMVNWIRKLRIQPDSFYVVHGRDFSDRKLFSATLDASHLIDVEVFKDLPHFHDVDLPRGLSLTWIDINPDIYTYLFDRKSGAPVGYINAMPVDESTFAKVLDGSIRDNEIRKKSVRPYSANAVLDIYLMSIATAPAVRRIGDGLFDTTMYKLVYAFTRKLEQYVILKNNRIRRIAAVAWTSEGEMLCKVLGLEKAPGVFDEFGNPVYMLELSANLGNKRVFPGLRHVIDAMARIKA
jgi:hypothetical protein